MFGLSFFVTSLALGAGLAMDAFSVSIADSLREPEMTRSRKALIAGTFGVFQFLMPVIGWFFVHELVSVIHVLTKFTPWISLILLLYLGIKMIKEGNDEDNAQGGKPVKAGELIVQGIATSIDALSVGFTISSYTAHMALIAGLLIGVTTFVLCLIALNAGHFISGRFKVKETTIGGIILIIIGIKVFLDGVIF
ncbi:MAG: manganese efflux pump [Firmicutes bacterium]|nr:manganese efflux pump [Bacillota bacterium]